MIKFVRLSCLVLLLHSQHATLAEDGFEGNSVRASSRVIVLSNRMFVCLLPLSRVFEDDSEVTVFSDLEMNRIDANSQGVLNTFCKKLLHLH